MAADALRLFPGPETVAALTAALDDRSAEVRLTAALSLAALGALPRLSTLIAKLIDESQMHSLLLRRLIEGIAAERPSEAMELALGTLGKPFLRPIALSALGSSGHFELGEEIATFTTDRDPKVRAAALEAMAGLGYGGAKDRVRQALSDPDQFVRVQAIESARRLELRDLGPQLLTLLKDDNWWVRFRANEALKAFGQKLSEGDRKLLEFAPAERGFV